MSCWRAFVGRSYGTEVLIKMAAPERLCSRSPCRPRIPMILLIPTIQARGFRSPRSNPPLMKSTLCQPPKQSKQAGAISILANNLERHNRLLERQHRRQALLLRPICSIPWYSVRCRPKSQLYGCTSDGNRHRGDGRRAKAKAEGTPAPPDLLDPAVLRTMPPRVAAFMLYEPRTPPPWRTGRPPDGMDDGSWCG